MMNRVLDRDYLRLAAGADQMEEKKLAALRPDGTWQTQSQMSYGEHSVTRLAYNLTRLQGGLALIDNIETSLHPYSQRILLHEIVRISEELQVQFIITTHSPETVGASPPAGRVFLSHQDGNIQAFQNNEHCGCAERETQST